MNRILTITVALLTVAGTTRVASADPEYSWKYYRPGNTGVMGDYSSSLWIAHASRGIGVLTVHTEVTGDVNGDGSVNVADLVMLLSEWGPCEGCPSDLDNDGEVGFDDLLLVLANWS